MRDAFVNSLDKLMSENSNVVLITGDLGFKIFDDIRQKYPKQFLNVGVAEQNMTGVAVGMALEGSHVFTYSIGNFTTLRCLEQIRNDAAYHELSITIVSSGGGFTYGSLGMSHHATEDLAIMRALPGVSVYAPCTPWETHKVMDNILEVSGVSYLRIEKGGYISPSEDSDIFEFNQSKIYREGDDGLIITTGGILEESMMAAEILSDKHNIELTIMGLHCLKPLDSKSVLYYSNKLKKVIVVEEHNKHGGLGSAISEVLVESSELVQFKHLGLNDQYSSVVGDQKYLRSYYGLNSESIIKSVLD